MLKIIQIFILFIFINNIFGQNDSTGIAHYFEEDKDRVVSQKNILKLNYLRASLNGNAVLSYERYLTPLLSLETHVGTSYWDLVSNFYYGIFVDDLDIDKRFKLGYSLGVGIRIYPKRDEMDGFYINPMYRYLRYNFGQKTDHSNVYDRFHTHDILGNVGYQLILRRWTLDYYIGLGVRFVNRKQQSLNNPFTVTESANYVLPMLPIGFRLGYSF
ncbi:MAG: hypothetical protein ACI9O4_002205 [Chitinophagales bacterium]|jgi:hypothetical protein